MEKVLDRINYSLYVVFELFDRVYTFKRKSSAIIGKNIIKVDIALLLIKMRIMYITSCYTSAFKYTDDFVRENYHRRIIIKCLHYKKKLPFCSKRI